MAHHEVTRAAIWARVSTHGQETDNQLTLLRDWAAQLGVNVVAEYITEDSAWAAPLRNGKGAEFDKARSEMLAGVRRGDHPVVLIYRLDRLSRRGSEDMQRYLRMLAEAGGDVRSNQDSWLNTADPFAREILLGVFASLAKYQSEQRSTNTKAGLKRRKDRDGLPIGRQAGSKDKTKRRRSGYVSAWEGPAGEARRAALAERNRARAQGKETSGQPDD